MAKKRILEERTVEDRICVYRVMYESGNSLTFREPLSQEFQRCTTCDGYDQRCEVYNVLCNSRRKFITASYKMREEVKREMRETKEK